MMKINHTKKLSAALCGLCLSFLLVPTSFAADSSKMMKKQDASRQGEEAKEAGQLIRDSAKVVQKMESEAGLKDLLSQSKGVFIVPHYGRAALGVGVGGGEGVLLVKQGQNWSDPAFYKFGGVSAGAQAGIEGGRIAFILNNDKAVNSFKQENKFSLNADAGLTIVNWSAKGQASKGKGDVVAWSDTKGLFGGLSVNVTDINFAEKESSAFFGKKVTPQEIISGQAIAPQQQDVALLKKALPSAGSTMSGGSTEKK